MASYMHNPMFGQDDSYDSGWGYDAGGSGYDAGYDSGGISAHDIFNVGGKLIDLAGRIIAPETYQQTYPGAQYPPVYTGPTSSLPAGVRAGTVGAAGSIDSNVLLIGGRRYASRHPSGPAVGLVVVGEQGRVL